MLRWEKAPYGRKAWFVDVSNGRWLIEYNKLYKKWTAKLNGELKAKAECKQTIMDYVSIECAKVS